MNKVDMRNVSRLAVVFLALGVALAIFAYVKANQLPGMLQYAVSAPETSPESPPESESGEEEARTETALLGSMRSIQETMGGLSDSVIAYTLTGYAPNVSVKDGADASQSADLYAISEKHFAIFPSLASEGRLLQDEELKYGDRVAMLSAQLAVDLFRVSDPTGKTIVIGDEEFVIAGVLRRGKEVGDASKYSVYLPLRAVAATRKIPLQTLTLSALPVPGSGAEISLENAMRLEWRPDGSFYQIEREKLRAMLLPRTILAFVWLYALVRLFGEMGRLAVGAWRSAHRSLRTNYLTSLLPGIAARIGLGVVILSALVLLCGLWAQFAMRPILLFPEWVPEVVVEWDDIVNTFWNLRFTANQRTQYLTGEVLYLHFFASVASAGSVIALIGLSVQLMFRIGRKARLDE